MPARASGQPSDEGIRPKIFAGLAGAWLGLALLKFGNPIILDRLVAPPAGFWEWVFNPWPVAWGYWMLAALAVIGSTIARFHVAAPRWLIVLPLAWFAWQLAAATQSVDARLSQATVRHFAACVVSFYVGLFALSRVKEMTWFWVPLLAGFAWVLWMGFGQHFGGLEATRDLIHQQPGWQQFSPEYLKRIESNRIFSTLVYPNALAGAILLFLPMLFPQTLRMTSRLTNVFRGVMVGLLGYAGAACLYWSGSKSGWLIALTLALTALCHVSITPRLKLALISAALVCGLTGFFISFSGYFRRGATSVSARFDYWRAACQITEAHPLWGSGPGTFSIPYQRLKTPESEMTKLVHNNYLEQASDSGVFGFLAYTTMIVGSVGFLYRKSRHEPGVFLVWLGLLGWSLQGVVEFGLYIPALAWPAFLFFGLLFGAEMKSTTPK